ncbi:gluconolactonase [Dyella lipolytica]|uniref:SMP-30/gluconolactonase/LRE family protein n=1 Tax=Dyella lipolytica TaxID=1867835 RepID=A0ABW8IUC6_9GAMM|nr:SMP-30/gluconolactonase/LRE family protein [Dyella lipolytica]GLQ46181.1 gluconolactonase [Dyella lipolytica]
MNVSTHVEDRGLVESPRWHEGKLWFADWMAGEILTLGSQGDTHVMARAKAPPLSFDFSVDGRMLIVASGEQWLLRREKSGEVKPFADLGGTEWNEIVVDGRGNAYVNGAELVLVTPDGKVQAQAEGFAFPNGMAVTPDNSVLIVAESHGRCLTAFDIAADGSLSRRRVWANLGTGTPDGICMDESGAVWYADVPNQRCVRVREGGAVLDEVILDRGAFACMLGGPTRQTLYITAANWFGMARMGEMQGSGQVLSVPVPVPGAGWPLAATSVVS